jgi:hypothetical protein
MRSPYSGVSKQRWRKKTEALIAAHPLDIDELVEVVLLSWEDDVPHVVEG